MHFKQMWQEIKTHKIRSFLSAIFFLSMFVPIGFIATYVLQDINSYYNLSLSQGQMHFLPFKFSLATSILSLLIFFMGVRFWKILLVLALMLLIPISINFAGYCIVTGNRSSDAENMQLFLEKYKLTKRLRVDGEFLTRIPYASIEELQDKNPKCCAGKIAQAGDVIKDNNWVMANLTPTNKLMHKITGRNRETYTIVTSEKLFDSTSNEVRDVRIRKHFIATNCGFRNTSTKELERF